MKCLMRTAIDAGKNYHFDVINRMSTPLFDIYRKENIQDMNFWAIKTGSMSRNQAKKKKSLLHPIIPVITIYFH